MALFFRIHQKTCLHLFKQAPFSRNLWLVQKLPLMGIYEEEYQSCCNWLHALACGLSVQANDFICCIDLGSCSHPSALKHLTFAYLFVGVSLGPAQICMYNLRTKLNICDMMLWMYAPWPAQAKACIQPISHHTIPPHIRPCSTLYIWHSLLSPSLGSLPIRWT